MLALQSVFGAVADNIWILIPLTALFIPLVAIGLEPVKQRLRVAERREARQSYERLVREKLDVLKMGVTMGYSQAELQQLDARLERLIGAEKLKDLLDPKASKNLDRQIEAMELQSHFDAAQPSGQTTVTRVG